MENTETQIEATKAQKVDIKSILDDDAKFFVFDVESLGLRGPGFAYGFVVVDTRLNELASGYGAIMPNWDMVDPESMLYLQTNVIPSLWGYTHRVDEKLDRVEQCEAWTSFRSDFWAQWQKYLAEGALMCADCPYPVEANFINACIEDNFHRGCESPYPLIDVGSVLYATGMDPTADLPRAMGEMPKHNPLCDARQSARYLINRISMLKRVFQNENERIIRS